MKLILENRSFVFYSHALKLAVEQYKEKRCPDHRSVRHEAHTSEPDKSGSGQQ
jgi:hypothetical protein